MKILRKKMYLPALSILLVVILMLILISVSTFRNLNRDREKALLALNRQGISLLQAIEAGVRLGFSVEAGLKMSKSIDKLIQETATGNGIAFIHIADKNGVIRNSSEKSKASEKILWPGSTVSADQPITRFREISPEVRLYELAKSFKPATTAKSFGTSFNDRASNNGAPYSKIVIVLALEMKEFENAHKTDFHHSIIMATIVLALGSAALFFIFVIQDYYLVDRTLKETRDYTNQVVANMANGLLSIDNNGKVVSYNLLALELLGLDENKVRGLSFQSIVDFSVTGISKTITQGIPVLDQEIVYQKPSGGTMPLSLSVTPIMGDNNTLTGAVILLRDLREIKQLEAIVRRSEKLAAIGELAAGVAHEIRNPLSSIRGFAQFLRHSLKDKPEDRSYADIMIQEVDRINQVVSDLLTFAKPMTLERSPINLSELIAHMIRLVGVDAQSKNVTIHTRVSESFTGVIWLDKNQLTQALLNLLLNALSAVPEKGEIEIGAGINDKGSGVNIWVEDNGVGIPPDHLDKIFGPFFTTREKGTGLGLAIVNKIVENHQGEINIQSPPEGKKQGTRITLTFPTIADGQMLKEV